MKRKFIILAIIVIILVIGTILLYSRSVGQTTNQNISVNGIILFYRTDCPHCQNVEKFIKDNQVSQKVAFIQKEVSTDVNNQKQLYQFAGQCKISQDQVGVPFLWDGSKCYIGDTDIINFFKQKIGLK